LSSTISLVNKSELTLAVTQARGAQRAAEIAKLKKPEAIAFAARALEGSGWLPEPLRSA
jgi:ParB family chromosome partitioning protein